MKSNPKKKKTTQITIKGRDIFYIQMIANDLYMYQRLGWINTGQLKALIKQRKYSKVEQFSLLSNLKKMNLISR